ncbi:tumor necrosis factor receptor superfamily member 13B [Malurus melanocephalus]|uniref:tumor necrosis factor receptor superfamily member 13B n=1 Tax=Malurus melanocephalus TaxID=175006 RepID=UPI002546D76E|nr:tumor necrosis factor receptor superfamily member 13B [Malurus melanocephalus]
MDGPRAGQDAMNNCTDQEYWDPLVSQCIPCSLGCSQAPARCDAVCESMDCNKKPGFYYDELVKSCIKCSSVCGQHPKECALSCEPTPAGPAAVLEQKACAEQEPWLVLYLLLGLCLCALLCSLLLGWTHLRRKGDTGSCRASAGTCPCREDPAKDGLVEAGSVGDGFTSIRIPEPVETCGFCFPGHGSAVQETKSCHSTSCHLGDRAAPSFTGICSTGSAGAVPSPDDGHFKIICSPSQEKTPTV